LARDEIFRPDLLAKFVSAPIYIELDIARRREIAPARGTGGSDDLDR
jgi:hypothetical protein